MQLQDDGTTCTHVVETPQSTMFVLCNSGQGDNAQHVGYLYAVYAVAKVTVYAYCYDFLRLAGIHVAAFTGGAYIQPQS